MSKKRNEATPRVLVQNGVSLVRDNHLYARLCDARDSIRDIATTLSDSCIDLHYSVEEAHVLEALACKVDEVVECVDTWRRTGWVAPPKWTQQ